METRFIIPAAVAMSLHAFVFLAFPRVPGSIRVPPPKLSEPQLLPVNFEDPPEPPPPAANQAASARGVPDLAPRSPEPPTPPDRPFVEIPRPPANPPSDPSRHQITIPAGPLGDPDGKGELVGPGIITSLDLDHMPRTRVQSAPAYPYEAQSSGRNGEVLVGFTVDETGRVLDPHVIRSTDRVFEGPTLRAVAKWRFEPGRKNGHVVRFRMVLPVQFAVNS